MIIKQAIEALELGMESTGTGTLHYACMKQALAALRSLPGVATFSEVYDAWGQTKLPMTMDPRPFFESGFRAAERRIFGEE